MKRRITLWMLFGILVACSWVTIALLAGPSYNPGQSTIAVITAPAALLGRKMPLSIWWFILLNGGLYGIVGLMIESLRWPLRSR
jgi:hypothetical protein